MSHKITKLMERQKALDADIRRLSHIVTVIDSAPESERMVIVGCATDSGPFVNIPGHHLADALHRARCHMEKELVKINQKLEQVEDLLGSAP